MRDAYLCTPVRTPIGRYGGALAAIRTDDLAAAPLRALIERLPDVDWEAVDDVVLGHPLGMTGARLAATAALELCEPRAKRALVTMGIGVGQGVAMAIEPP
jgi:acetyl-CoA acetyltransferase